MTNKKKLSGYKNFKQTLFSDQKKQLYVINKSRNMRHVY